MEYKINLTEKKKKKKKKKKNTTEKIEYTMKLNENKNVYLQRVNIMYKIKWNEKIKTNKHTKKFTYHLYT